MESPGTGIPQVNLSLDLDTERSSMLSSALTTEEVKIEGDITAKKIYQH